MRNPQILIISWLTLAGGAAADELIIDPTPLEEGQFVRITARHELGCPLIDKAVETFDQGIVFTFFETCDCFPGIYGEVQESATLPPVHVGDLRASVRLQRVAGDVFCGPSIELAETTVAVRASSQWHVDITQPPPAESGGITATIDSICPIDWGVPARDGFNLYLFADGPPSGIECTAEPSFRAEVSLGTLAPGEYALVLLEDYPWAPAHLFQHRFTVTEHATSSLLLASRFEAHAAWTIHSGETGTGSARSLTTDSGAFWFFDPSNLELTVKVLDGCGINGHRWLMASGMTDVGVELTVLDVQTGAERTYVNPLGNPFAPILDTSAFACF